MTNEHKHFSAHVNRLISSNFSVEKTSNWLKQNWYELPVVSCAVYDFGNCISQRCTFAAHPSEFADVLLHRQTVEGAGDTEKSCQETRSEAQLQRKTGCESRSADTHKKCFFNAGKVKINTKINTLKENVLHIKVVWRTKVSETDTIKGKIVSFNDCHY